MMKVALMVVGILSLIVGLIGMLVPILPTTPLVLLSAACFMKSSKRLHGWLVNNKLFGKYLSNYINHGTVTKAIKIGSLLFMLASLSTSFLFIDNLYVRIILIVVGLGVAIHLILLKTISK